MNALAISRPAPDLSPQMLRLFLRARIAVATPGLSGGALFAETRRSKAHIRRAAGVTNTEFDLAWMGRLNPDGPALAKLWRALGVEIREVTR